MSTSMPRWRSSWTNLGTAPVACSDAEDAAVLVEPGLRELEDGLHDDRVAFHAGDLGDVGDLARAVGQAGALDDEVDRRGDLLADGARGQVEAGHEHQRLEARERVARRVGVQRGQRAVVAGVHRLEHVERLAAAALADDDAVGPHAQRVDHQLADGDFALALDARRLALERDDVVLRQAQFRRVLDRHDALRVRDEAAEDVEERRLAGAGAAGDDDVAPVVDGQLAGTRPSPP